MLAKRFQLPPGCNDKQGNPITSVVIRELTVGDEATIAILAETNSPEAMDTFSGQTAAIGRESIRLSLVEVNGERIETAEPYMAMDQWSRRTLMTVRRFFNDLNSLPEEAELKKLVAAGEIVVLGG